MRTDAQTDANKKAHLQAPDRRWPNAVQRQDRPGDYGLQVIVTDKLVKKKRRVATQSLDFEIQAAPPPQR